MNKILIVELFDLFIKFSMNQKKINYSTNNK